MTNYRRLSKTMAHALRHDPAHHGLTLDQEGWTDVDALLAAMARHRSAWASLGRADLEAMMTQADKQRFEMRGARIRARYGHSLPQPIRRQPAPPPANLFHGTSPRAAATIRRQGLQAMKRQYVHLAADRETAVRVGRRKAPRPTVLVIRARAAHEDGLPFYPTGDDIWLVEEVPPDYIDFDPAFQGQDR